MLLIGSRAARFWYPEFRKPKDYDFIATTKEVDDFLSKFTYQDTSSHPKKRRARVDVHGYKLNFEFELVEHYPSSAIIYKNDTTIHNYDNLLGIEYVVAGPQTLYLLKKSHIIFNIHWDKNIYDYLFLKDKCKPFDIFLPGWKSDALRLRFDEIKNRIKSKEINFNQKNSEFFKKSEKFVNRVVEHDSLHYATCFYDEPLFLSAKEDTTKAALSKEKVRQMPHLHIIQMIQEEAMVLALERDIIPCLLEKKPYNAKGAYHKTAARMVHNYLPYFLRYFAADNFLEILDLKVDYVQLFLERHPTFKELLS
jgi:hypothetical protein